MAQSTPSWKFELVLAIFLLVVGLLVPAAVFLVGGAVVGDYAGEGGAWGLITSVWTDAARGRPAAWALLLAPFLVVQLMRLSWVCLRSGRTVTELTNI